MSKKANELSITVLDYESTGTVSGLPAEPWQIGCVYLENGRMNSATLYESLLRVGPRPFSPYAPGRHHQLRREIAAAPTPQENWTVLQRHLLNRPLCAHNVGTEKKFTRQTAPLHRFGPWIDTLRLSRAVWPNACSYDLENLCNTLNLKPRAETLLPGRDYHDALFDACCGALLLEYILALPAWGQLTLDELLHI